MQSFLWQLYDEVVQFVLNVIRNSEIVEEWYYQEKMVLCQKNIELIILFYIS